MGITNDKMKDYVINNEKDGRLIPFFWRNSSRKSWEESGRAWRISSQNLDLGGSHEFNLGVVGTSLWIYIYIIMDWCFSLVGATASSLYLRELNIYADGRLSHNTGGEYMYM